MTRAWLRAVALAALIASAAPAAADPAAEAAIRGALESWTASFNARDAGAVCDLFAPDVVATYRGQPERGHDEVCALLQSSLRNPERSYRYRLELKEIIVSGDLAAVRLVWHLAVTDRSGAALASDAEPGLDIFRRQADGRWRIIRYLAYGEGGR